MIRDYQDRGQPDARREPAEDRWRLTKEVAPQYPKGYLVAPHNVLLPRWKRMGLVERVDPVRKAETRDEKDAHRRPRRASARGD